MNRKRYFEDEESSDSHDRWLVSYADFVTLMFAFFVVMYAISSVNDGKYEILSHSLINAFNSELSPRPRTPNSTTNSESVSVVMRPEHIGFEENDLSPPYIPKLPPIVIQEFSPTNSNIDTDEKQILRVERQKKMRNMAQDLIQALSPLVEDGKVRITQSLKGITVEINASVLFSPGQAKLGENSKITLQAVAQVVKDHEHEIHVEGHTDNVSINTTQFPSNWELSTARSSSVIRLFVENGVAPHRLTALGYGENRSVQSNETLEGRKRNRRVAVMILAKEPDTITEIPVDSGSDNEMDNTNSIEISE